MLLLPLPRGPSRAAEQGAGTRRRPAALPAQSAAVGALREFGTSGRRGGLGVTSLSGCPSVRRAPPPRGRERVSAARGRRVRRPRWPCSKG